MGSIEEFAQDIADFINSNNERAAVIVAFSMIEQFISDLLELRSKHPSSYKHLSIAVKISLLHDIGELSDREFECIDWLRKQRNKAAHKRGFTVQREGIFNNRCMMGVLQGQLDPLREILLTTVGAFWNKHREIQRRYLDNDET